MSVIDLPFAMPGDRVTCENGHHICTVANPLFRFGAVRIEDFTFDGNTPAPKAGDTTVKPCPDCGALFMRMKSIGGQDIHINGRWAFQGATTV